VPANALALALGAAFLHALWNLLLARENDTEAATAVGLLTVVAVLVLPAALTWRVEGAAVPYLAGSAALELAYFALLGAAYRR
jgi:tryptophan-rich sensory protein